jgi:hypothetical protein
MALDATLAINSGSQVFHADAEPSGDGSYCQPRRGHLAALDPAVGAQGEIGRVADALLGPLAVVPKPLASPCVAYTRGHHPGDSRQRPMGATEAER